MRATAAAHGWKLTGKFEACEFCAMSNAQQKAVPKKTEDQSMEPGERIFMDMSTVSEHESLGGAKVWLCAVDDATGCVWNHLIKKKSDAPERMKILFNKMSDRGTPVKKVRLDDAAENKKLARLCEEADEKYLRDIKFEFTGRDTPQRNGKVERKIAGMTRRIKATLNAAKLDKKLRQVLWGECIMFLTDVENVLQSRRYDKPSYSAFFKQELEGLKFLRQFGEVGYVKFGPKIQGKLHNRGLPMMYLGRPRNHSGDTYRMLNLNTRRIVTSRDVVWLNKVYGEWKGLATPTMPDKVTILPIEKLEEEVLKVKHREKRLQKESNKI